MGALFLFQKAASIDIEAVHTVFLRKGFSEPERFDLGRWALLSYKKLLVKTNNWICFADGSFVFCCGTVIYRGLGYQESLERIGIDFRNGNLDKTELLGSFWLLFWDGNRIYSLADRLNTQHVFANGAQSCLSSSFLAVVAASQYPMQINRSALVEKLATGYIMSPDTLVEGIHRLNNDVQDSFPKELGIVFIDHRPIPYRRDIHRNGFDESIQRQLRVLKKYFSNLRALDHEYHAELGLSSGYDSRLLLALSRDLPSSPIPLHSHHTATVHESELSVAHELAAIKGNELTVVPTTAPEDMGEDELRSLVFDNVFFFDGRCTNDMGSFNATYTAQYRVSVLGPHRLSLHGLGGEIYRNAYIMSRGRLKFEDWMNLTVLYPFAREVCGTSHEFVAMGDNIRKKLEKRLGLELRGKVSFHMNRWYYGVVRMPEGASNVANAYNQVAFTVLPFMEPMTLQESLRATPYIGVDGEYEAAMIRALAPELALVRSQYGHAFTNIPLRYKLKYAVTGLMPVPIRSVHRRRYCLSERRNVGSARYKGLRNRSKLLREIEEVLYAVLPNADWGKVLQPQTQRATAISVGSFLKAFEVKLRF